MSALRRILAAAVFVGAVAAPARAQDSVVVAVAADVGGRTGELITVPVTVDLAAAPGRLLGGYRLTLAFDQTRLQFYGVTSTGFATPLVATDSAYAFGRVRLTAVMPAGAAGLVELFEVRFAVLDDAAPSTITIELIDLNAAGGSATPFEDLLPIARVVNGTFCRSVGRWGDLDHDGRANSRDALMALSTVVGLPLSDTLATAALGDVDDDGAVSSRDALIILSYAVGLPVPGFRVLLTATGACGTAATTLVIAPGAIELQVGQLATVLVQATDRLGRVVPASPLTWLSSDPGIAAFDGGNGAIEGRGAGTATLTAQLGPGVQAQLTVTVLGRRSTWYVDVRRARNSPTRTGSVAHPFEFIGDALDEAGEGDTVRVAGGVYEEVVSRYTSVNVLGDSLDRPVIDPRGAPYWSGGQALQVGSGSGSVELAHLVVRAGGIYIESREQFLHNLAIENPGSYSGIETYNQAGYDGGGGELQATPSALQLTGGRTVIENVLIQRATYRGMEIQYPDTAVIRNNVVVGDSTRETCSVYAGSGGGIMVDGGRAVQIQDNTVTGMRCAGIGAFARGGWARIDRNRVSRIGSVGIAAAGPDVRTSGNHVRDVGADSGYYYYYSVYGIWASDSDGPQDTLRSYADTVLDVEGIYAFGLYADSAVNAAVDLFRADSIGMNPSAYEGTGLEVRSGWFTMTNSRVRETRSYGFRSTTPRRAIGLRDNEYRGIGGTAVSVTVYCECSTGVDSVTSVGDTIDVVGYTGMTIESTGRVMIDSASVDSAAGYGIAVSYGTDARVSRSSITNAATGLYSYGTQALRLLGNMLSGDTLGINYYSYNASDTAWVTGTTVTGGGTGILLNGRLFLDSSVVASNSVDGAVSAGKLRVTRSRFQGNGQGIVAQLYSDTTSIANSNFIGNALRALVNQSGITADADSNYWNDSRGPACAGSAIGCDSLSVGDSIDGSVTFAPHDSAMVITPAPRRTLAAAAPRISAAQVDRVRRRAGAPAAARPSQPDRGPAPVSAPRPARSPRQFPAPWRKGRPAATVPQRP